jgi:radical SAM superfamily enzyme
MLCVFVPPQQARIVEQEEMAVAKQRLGKYFHEATNTHATIELLDAMFSVRLVSH